MRDATILFGGALLGALVAGATGLDFFPATRAEVVRLERATRELERLHEEQREGAEALAAARAENRRQGEKLRAARDAEAEVARRVTRLLAAQKEAEGSMRSLKQRLRVVAGQLDASSAHAAGLARELARTRAREDGLVEAIFSLERPESFAALAAEYLRSDAPVESKLALVFRLRAVNPHILASLPPRPAPRSVLVPVSATIDHAAESPLPIPSRGTGAP